MGKKLTAITVLAGRRIDSSDASIPRFPLAQVDFVQKQIEALFQKEQTSMLICSAACGADLIALQIAQILDIDYRIVLPFAPEEFRVTSVIDRPGTDKWNWGAVFDQIIELAKKKDNLVVLDGNEDNHSRYQAVNHAIFKEAQHYAWHQGTMQSHQGLDHHVEAIIVWDGQPRGPRDLTWHFAEEARVRGLVVKEILTLLK